MNFNKYMTQKFIKIVKNKNTLSFLNIIIEVNLDNNYAIYI